MTSEAEAMAHCERRWKQAQQAAYVDDYMALVYSRLARWRRYSGVRRKGDYKEGVEQTGTRYGRVARRRKAA